MKKFKFLWSLMALPLLAACSSDDVLKNDPGKDRIPEGAGVYMTLNIEMPSGKNTRSQTKEDGTSTGGTEVGTLNENNVASVLIVLARKSDNAFIFAGTVPTTSIVPDPSNNSYNTTAKFQKSDLADYYNANVNSTNGNLSPAEQEVNVFAFCNPPTSFSSYIEDADLGNTEWYNQTMKLTETKPTTVNAIGSTENSIWTPDLFTMSNAKIATKKLPPTIDDWDGHKTPITAFNLSGVNHPGDDEHIIDNSGSVSVERLACRFDFKDGSTLGDNTYNVVFESDGTTPIIQVELTKMMLTNMAKEFYILPRVSADGQLSNSTLCGTETKTNYLVGPKASDFDWDKIPAKDFVFGTYFNYPFFTQDNKYNFSNWAPWQIKEVLNGNDDNLAKEYKVWRYATENVIPAGVSNQTYGKSTIIAFKGRLKVPEALKDNPAYSELYNCLNGNITGNPNTDPILYALNGNLYVSWDEVRKAAIAASVQMTDNVPDVVEVEEVIDGVTVKVNKFTNVSRSNPLYAAVFGDGGMNTFVWGNTTYLVGDGITPEASAPNTIYVKEPTQDEESSNYLWTVWDDANKPTTGEAISDMRAAMTDVNFTLYQSSTDAEDGNGYYCYYFYRNRHNDNNKPGEMGPMEFATVRNNVYKLAVTNISQLGHPRLTENDPEPPKPDTPDETDEVYLTVTCQVLPWTVRVNNIEF